MEKTNWYIENGNNTDFLFTYSEEEKQQNDINKENAKLIFSPEFIPFYIEMLDFWLTNLEVLLYWFIRFYKKNWTGKFYFTDKQLSSILKCSEITIQRAVKKLKEKKIVLFSHKIKAWWWTVRFVNQVMIPIRKKQNGYNTIHQDDIEWIHQNDTLILNQNDITNNNKINNNKINNNKINNNKINNNKKKEFINNKEQSSKSLIINKEKYWNEDINKMQELIEETVSSLWLIYKRWKYERARIQNIISGKDYGKICVSANLTREEFMVNIFKLSMKLDFRRWKLNNAETFYKFYDKVYNEAVNLKKKKEDEQIKSVPTVDIW